MYEQRFGLNSNPFRGGAQGSSIFVGPKHAKVISKLQQALSGADNVVTVCGDAGCGKTAIVSRALETNKSHQVVAWIDRMRLAPDEVLDLLLAGLGAGRIPSGTVQKFALFQRILSERANANVRVVIVVEDALRIGNDALLELEALTSSDTGNGAGANIILMGPTEVEKRVTLPELARLRQRSRHAQTLEPLSAQEVHGYIKHRLRAAGGDFDTLFELSAATMVYRCSQGIPRVINNICDAALTAAADRDCAPVTAALVEEVAANVYGLEPVLDDPQIDTNDPDPVVVQAEKVIESAAVAELAGVPATADSDSVVNDVEHEESLPVDDIEEVPVSTFDPEPGWQPSADMDVTAEPTDPSNDVKPIGDDTEATDDTTEDALPVADDEDEFQLPDGDFLIADTGMNVAPEFLPDTDLEIPSSQLAATEDVAADTEDSSETVTTISDDAPADETAADDDIPMLSNSMRIEVDVVKDEPPAATDTIDAADELDDESPDTVTIKKLDMPIESIVENPATVTIEQPEIEAAAAEADNADAAPPVDNLVPAERPVPDLDALEAAMSAARAPELAERPVIESRDAPDTVAEDELPVIEPLSEPVAEQSADPDEQDELPAVAAESKAQTAEDAGLDSPVDLDPLVDDLPPAEDSDGVNDDIADDSPSFIDPATDLEKAAEEFERQLAEMQQDAAEPAEEPTETDVVAIAADNSGAADEPAAAVDEAPQTDHLELQTDNTGTDDGKAEEDVPQITLDQSLEDQRLEGAKLDEMAEELANANSLEDISDVMAETLFGIEFEQIAQEALKNPPAAGTLPGDEEASDVIAAQDVDEEVTNHHSANDSGNHPSPALLDDSDDESELPITDQVVPEPPEMPQTAMPAAADTANPESIEDQFQTSITQTLKALDVARIADEGDEPEEEKKPGGLFGRIKKTFGG